MKVWMRFCIVTATVGLHAVTGERKREIYVGVADLSEKNVSEVVNRAGRRELECCLDGLAGQRARVWVQVAWEGGR